MGSSRSAKIESGRQHFAKGAIQGNGCIIWGIPFCRERFPFLVIFGIPEKREYTAIPHKEHDMTLGKNLKDRRIKMGMTQKDLADKMNVTFQTISKWENDENEPDLATLK